MFLSSRLAGASDDRSPWGNFWFQPVGLKGSGGVRVTSVNAMRLSAVYSCVRVLGETFAVLPLVLYKKKTNGGRQIVTDHWLYRLLARRPNAWQTPFEWREMMMGHLVLRGNAFNQMISNGKGEVTDLIPLHPDRIRVELLDNNNYRYQYTPRNGVAVTLQRGEVWHIRGLSSDGIVGLNPMEQAAEVLGLGLAAQGYASRFYANDAKPGGWIELPGKFADGPTRDTFKADWKKSQGGANRGGTAVLESGMKYHELGLNNSDAQFIETRKQNRSEIASIFRVPPHKIGDLERATFSNIEQQSLDFVNDCMSPWAERWESSVETNLLFDDEGLEVEFDFKNLLRGDSKARASYYNSGIVSGWLTRNEARIQEGLDPLDGLDEPLQPLNMASAGDAASVQNAGLKDGQKNEAEARRAALAGSAAERVARKETAGLLAALQAPNWPEKVAAFSEKHARFVCESLGVPLEAAVDYCRARGFDAIRTGHEEQDIHAAALEKLETLALKGKL